MKIVHIILTSHFAGSERYAIELANAQSKFHDVSIILASAGAESRPDALAHRIDSDVKILILKNKFSFLQIFETRKLIKQLCPEVAHAHLSGACRALSGLKSSCLRIATLHIHYKKQQHKKLDALIAIAPWQINAIPDQLKKHTQQIDNWTEIHSANISDNTALRKKFDIAEDALVFGALGRVVESKGFDTLIKAFELANIPNSRLVIVGQGKQWQTLRNLAHKNVVMPGFWAKPTQWYSCFDIFVSSARSEPFGLVFLEAMASGLPILATASQGAKHLQPLINTALVPIDDIKALSEGLLFNAAQPRIRKKYDLSKYALSEKIDEIEQFYRQQIIQLHTK